jgi:hypothetical protein
MRVRERIVWACRIVFDPTHLKRTLLVTLVVGLVLSFSNDGGQILDGSWTATLVGKIAINFCTPFIVANLGLLAHHSKPSESARKTPGKPY